MKINMKSLIDNINTGLTTNYTGEDIFVLSPGESKSLIFQVKEEYLYKIYDSSEEYKNSTAFFEHYKGNDYFQQLQFKNDDEKSHCLTYLKGNLLLGMQGDYSYLIDDIFRIVSTYKEYDETNIERFNYGTNTWSKFLENNINFNYIDIVDKSIVEENIKVIEKYNIKNYMLHADFGSHNFIIGENGLKVIDPCACIGDKLFDFYCGIFSDPIIFANLNIKDILEYFEEYDMEYKIALAKLCFIFRIEIALKFNCYSNTEIYYTWYESFVKGTNKLSI